MGSDPGSATYRKFQRQPRCLCEGGNQKQANHHSGKSALLICQEHALFALRPVIPNSHPSSLTSAKRRFASLRKIAVVSWETYLTRAGLCKEKCHRGNSVQREQSVKRPDRCLSRWQGFQMGHAPNQPPHEKRPRELCRPTVPGFHREGVSIPSVTKRDRGRQDSQAQ